MHNLLIVHRFNRNAGTPCSGDCPPGGCSPMFAQTRYDRRKQTLHTWMTFVGNTAPVFIFYDARTNTESVLEIWAWPEQLDKTRDIVFVDIIHLSFVNVDVVGVACVSATTGLLLMIARCEPNLCTDEQT